MENNELYHFGIKGMKWGIRRYQNEDGSLTPEGRDHYGYSVRRAASDLVKSIKTKHQAKVELKKKEKQKKERVKRLEAARKAKAAKKAHEEEKEKALRSGSAQDVLKFKDELTTQERNDAYNRLQSEANLSRLASDERRYAAEEAASKSKWNKFVNLTNKAGQLSTSIENTTKLYNSFAKVYNAFSDDPLPMIGDKKQAEKYAKSKEMASKLLKKIGNKSLYDIETELTRIDAVRRAEGYASGEQTGVKGQYSAESVKRMNKTDSTSTSKPKEETKKEAKKEEPKASTKEETKKETYEDEGPTIIDAEFKFKEPRNSYNQYSYSPYSNNLLTYSGKTKKKRNKKKKK